MLVMDAIAQILKREGVQTPSCFPTTPLIEAAARPGCVPIICRQERVGVDIADGFARVTNGPPPGVFAMQYGPGAENAFPGIATRLLGLRPAAAAAARSPGRPARRLPAVQVDAHLRVGDQARRAS